MIIRAANNADLGKLDACMQELLQYESQFDGNIDGSTVITDNFAPFIEQNERWIWVAEEDGDIAGYCCGFAFKEFARKEAIAVLDSVYVKEKYRRQGCATALISAFLSVAREKKIRYMELKVLAENEVAYKLYTSLGFEEKEKKLRLSL